MATDGMDKIIKDILENPFWIPGLESKTQYSTHDDDTPDSTVAILSIIFSDDGDAWVAKWTDPSHASIRKRTHAGGGKDLRTRQAIMILAFAMKLDEEEREDHNKKYEHLKD